MTLPGLKVPRRLFFGALGFVIGVGAANGESEGDPRYYFPPVGGEWETVSPAEVSWDEAKLDVAFDFLESQSTTGVVILHRGRILAERYWELTGENSVKFNQRLAGKDTHGRGIEDVASAGAKWFYNTPVYAKAMAVVEKAAGMDRHQVTREWLTQPLGMGDSRWVSRGALGVTAGNAYGFATTARDLARFGLFMLAGGEWNGQVVLKDRDFLEAVTQSSQRLNPRYGYLWWVARNAFAEGAPPVPVTGPPDMFMAKGALMRRCYVVPSMDLVVTRLGDQPEVGRAFDRQFWRLLMAAAKPGGKPAP